MTPAPNPFPPTRGSRETGLLIGPRGPKRGALAASVCKGVAGGQLPRLGARGCPSRSGV